MNEFFAHLRRLPRTHGFGVQSPADYHFITRVLRRPISEDIFREMPQDKGERQVARLVYLIRQEIETQAQETDIHVEDLTRLNSSDIDRLMADIADNTYFILSNLRASQSTLALFHHLVAHPRRKITFDLYSTAVLHLTSRRYSEMYKINF